MRTILRAAAIFFLLALAIQLFRITRDNPPVTGTIAAPPAIAATLKRSCFDCHSNETIWPWYSRVAPASWLVAHDVHEGREHLNFSTWASLSPVEKQKILQRMAEVVENGAMPPGIYTPLHPDARLSLQDTTMLAEWARAKAKEP